MNNILLKLAAIEEVEIIWNLLQEGILKRKNEGSNQWQDGYPNLDVVKKDIAHQYGYVAVNDENKIVGYFAIINEIEPAYEAIEGNWLSDPNIPYAVIHRLIVDLKNPIKGLATFMMQKAEEIVRAKQINTIKVDTNFDNVGMLKVFDRLGNQYCGEVYFRGSARKAYEKILK